MTNAQFTTIRTADLLDSLVAAVDAARIAAGDDQRWQNAITSAWDYILQTETLDYDANTHALKVASASGNGSYIANGACSCRAAELDKPCWHRAAARIVTRALELAEQAQADAEQAELTALAQELLDEARRAGVTWYGAREALAGARSRMAELMAYAAEWDAAAEVQRRAALAGRIVAAHRQLAVAA